ncbi:nuclear transcription factor Y subunit gamma-like isoform X2 [Anneissia japonica]|uniref:nuclear transcription factor Y subunit gamma-like isoform X2 n=1 Tax=Anneissia japonica TaxID=1529436 RepID=UPI001425A655|nr:nuclear transcription factor Y subunit gamma-like isoform X2 [Anneissia japonica]
MNTSTQAVVSGEDSQSESQTKLTNFWTNKTSSINKIGMTHFKTQELPLARIKKIMKLDEDVKMISAEAPVLFSKAAEIFISELSLRAWLHTEENKRRTLQRNDIAMAISKYDQFDFLIDIVPRDELKPTKRQETHVQQTGMLPDQVQYYFQLAQNQAVQQLRQGTQQQQQQPQQQQQQQAQTIQVANVTQGQQFISIPSGVQVQTGAAQQLQQIVNQSQAQQQVQAGGDSQTTQLVQADGTTAQMIQTADGQPAQLVQAGGQTIQLQDGSQNAQIVFGGQQIQYLRQGQFVTAEISGSQPVFQIQQLPIQTQAGTTQQVFLQPTTTDSSGETVQVTQ